MMPYVPARWSAGSLLLVVGSVLGSCGPAAPAVQQSDPMVLKGTRSFLDGYPAKRADGQVNVVVDISINSLMQPRVRRAITALRDIVYLILFSVSFGLASKPDGCTPGLVPR